MTRRLWDAFSKYNEPEEIHEVSSNKQSSFPSLDGNGPLGLGAELIAKQHDSFITLLAGQHGHLFKQLDRRRKH